MEELKKAGLPYQEYHFQDAFALYLPNVHEYTLRGLDIYKEGKIYVQSLSSMIPVQCLDLHP